MKTCKDLCDCLSDYLDGEMSEDQCKLIEEHLDRCPPCQLMYQSLLTTVEICGKALPAEVPDEARENFGDSSESTAQITNVNFRKELYDVGKP